METTCGCGCGLSLNKNRIFRQGHDAKLRSKLLEHVFEEYDVVIPDKYAGVRIAEELENKIEAANDIATLMGTESCKLAQTFLEMAKNRINKQTKTKTKTETTKGKVKIGRWYYEATKAGSRVEYEKHDETIVADEKVADTFEADTV